jgi:hypothetical protein
VNQCIPEEEEKMENEFTPSCMQQDLVLYPSEKVEEVSIEVPMEFTNSFNVPCALIEGTKL